MEQVRMAPLGTVAYIVGKTLPYFCISHVLVDRRSSWRRWCCSGCR